ncbi:MAG: M12 family metallo-peptidase [Chitinophagaceae bacterium]
MKTSLKFLILTLFFFSCSKSSVNYINNPDAPDYLHNRAVGASAAELLTSNTYKSVKIEIQYMTGFAPDAGAVSHLQSLLSSLLNKPSGITVVTKEITGSSSQALSINDVIDIEKKNRTAFTMGDQLALYLLYTNGNYTDASVLGAAYKNTSVVLFGKKIHDNSGGLGQSSATKLEATVAEHEMGHLLGLVDNGTPMLTNHKDANHGSHCNNNNCLMYYASETTDILGFLITGNIPSFDANCKADMHSNGGL